MWNIMNCVLTVEKRGLKSTEGIDISDEKHSEGKCKWYSRRGMRLCSFYWLLCCTKNKLITSTFIFYIIDYFKGCDFYTVNIPFVFSEIICDPPRIPNGVYRPELSKYRGQDKITYECKKGFIPEIRGTEATCTRDGWAPAPRCACMFHSYLDLLNCEISFS